VVLSLPEGTLVFVFLLDHPIPIPVAFTIFNFYSGMLWLISGRLPNMDPQQSAGLILSMFPAMLREDVLADLAVTKVGSSPVSFAA
jgi:hypothetical protein